MNIILARYRAIPVIYFIELLIHRYIIDLKISHTKLQGINDKFATSKLLQIMLETN